MDTDVSRLYISNNHPQSQYVGALEVASLIWLINSLSLSSGLRYALIARWRFCLGSIVTGDVQFREIVFLFSLKISPHLQLSLLAAKGSWTAVRTACRSRRSVWRFAWWKRSEPPLSSPPASQSSLTPSQTTSPPCLYVHYRNLL